MKTKCLWGIVISLEMELYVEPQMSVVVKVLTKLRDYFVQEIGFFPCGYFAGFDFGFFLYYCLAGFGFDWIIGKKVIEAELGLIVV